MPSTHVPWEALAVWYSSPGSIGGGTTKTMVAAGRPCANSGKEIQDIACNFTDYLAEVYPDGLRESCLRMSYSAV